MKAGASSRTPYPPGGPLHSPNPPKHYDKTVKLETFVNESGSKLPHSIPTGGPLHSPNPPKHYDKTLKLETFVNE